MIKHRSGSLGPSDALFMIYLDNNASTKPDELALKKSVERVSNAYANPSSLHQMGCDARELIETSRDSVAKSIGVDSSEVVFTSGGTEANNIVLNSFRGRKAISCVEHSSVYNCEHDFVIPYSRSSMSIDYSFIRSFIKSYGNKALPLVSLMAANNETGEILADAEELSDIKKKTPFHLHLDACQFYGKSTDNDIFSIADSISLSGHKIHSLPGIGCLILRKDCTERLSPLFKGGSHEFGLRPGTENKLGIVNMGEVSKTISGERHKEKLSYIKELRDRFEDELAGIAVPNGGKKRICNTSNLWFKDVEDIGLFLELLSSNGVFASGGSACSSGMASNSRVLESIYGSNSPQALGSVRFSFSRYNTVHEVENAVSIIRDSIRFYLSIRR